MSEDLVFITFPTGRDGRDKVAINVTQIAAFRSHTVVSYTYEEHTEVLMKSGEKYDLHVKKVEFERKLKEALGD